MARRSSKTGTLSIARVAHDLLQYLDRKRRRRN
jgi:hypothetical protein